MATPRKRSTRTRNHDEKSWLRIDEYKVHQYYNSNSYKWRIWSYKFVTDILSNFKIGLHIFLSVLLYRYTSGVFPGKFAKIFLVILILQGFPKYQTKMILKKILQGVLNSLL